VIVETFYDAAVSGADPVNDRPGFAQMLERLLSNGAWTILVESPDRFARDLMVQLAGHDMLKAKGISLIAASAPTLFIEDTPTAVLVRQVALDNFKGVDLFRLDRAAVLAGHLDALMRPAIATIQQRVRGRFSSTSAIAGLIVRPSKRAP
jgi:hypothetical protein